MNTKIIITLCLSLASILGTAQAQTKTQISNIDSTNTISLTQGVIKGLMPGDDAPDFHLTAIDGREISLSDCFGSYVLIYHWGLCAGSLIIDSEVIELYNKYKDNLTVIGITDSIEMIKEHYDEIIRTMNQILEKYADRQIVPKINIKIAGTDIDTKLTLENMLAHPWFDTEKTGNNKKIETDFAFEGWPYFVFISPEGKIIARDFQEAFYVAKNTMDSEFGK